jgi:hypothetical protein
MRLELGVKHGAFSFPWVARAQPLVPDGVCRVEVVTNDSEHHVISDHLWWGLERA